MNESLKKHLKSLKQKHRELDEEIMTMYKNYADDLEVDRLKLEKLYLKREIEGIKQRMS